MNPKRAQNSRLIEFPRKARAAVEKEVVSNPLPAWRQEVSEKVRAAKARRNLTPDPAPVQEPAQPVCETDYAEPNRAEANRYEKPFTPRTGPLTAPAASSQTQRERAARPYAGMGAVESNASSAAAPARTVPRTNDTIVEAALTRVRRATENASRATLPKIEPVRPVQPAKSALIIDREATARALEPRPVVETKPIEPAAAEPAPKTRLVTTPLPRIEEEPEAAPEPVIAVPEKAEPQLSARPAPAIEPVDIPKQAEEAIREKVIVIDEMDPVDYIAAEMNKVAAGDEIARDESPAFFAHVVIGITDLATIALSCSPFFALIEIMNGNYADGRTLAAGVAIVLFVSGFYLAITQSLCGKTFGMMLTNTRVVDAGSYQPVTTGRALLRTLGYFVALAPFGLGLLWFALNRRRRAWQDYISNTLVTSDF